MDALSDKQILGLVSELPVSDVGEKLLHLQPGSKLGLYLLGLSDLAADAQQVEAAEEALSRPLHWILEVIYRNTCEGSCGMEVSDFEAKLSHPDEKFFDFIPHYDGAKLRNSLRSYFALALKSSMVTLVGDQVMLSLMGLRQLRNPQAVLPLIAFALSDKDNEGTFLRIIMSALAQTFADADWAIPTTSAEVAVQFLAEMEDSCEVENAEKSLQIFNNFIYAAGCTSTRDDTAIVLLQYLFSEALQP